MLTFAYGLAGLGGNLLFIAAIQFSNLFENNALATACYSGAFQATSFISTALVAVALKSFLQCYVVACGMGLVIVFICFPDVPCEAPGNIVQACSGIRILASSGSGAGPGFLGAARTLLRRCWEALVLPRTWCFLLGFAWTATVAAWGTGGFYGVLDSKLHEIGEGSAEYEEGMKVQDLLVELQPLVSNSVFFFVPFIGAFIDKRGFTFPVVGLCFSVGLLGLSMSWLPLDSQWISLLALNVLQSFVYTVQISYMTKTYPADQFGLLMALTTVAQAIVNPLGTKLCGYSPTTAAAVFAGGAIPICSCWATMQWSMRRKGVEFVRQEQ